MDKGYLIPEAIFEPTGELISNRDILKLAIRAGIPVSFVFRGREKYVEPKFLYAAGGSDYLMGYDLGEENLATYGLEEIDLVFLVEGRSRYPVIDILKNEHHTFPLFTSKVLQKIILRRCPRIVNNKNRNSCCRPQPRDKIIGEIMEDGSPIIHLFDCKEANRYWW